MSSDFNEAEFEQFRARADQAESELHMLTVLQRIQSFLVERGVVLETEPGDSDQAILECFNARGELRKLAALSAYFEALREVGAQDVLPSPDYKKKLQANYLVHGYGGPWQDAIDQEIPGEPLGENDGDLIAQVAIETIQDDHEAQSKVDEAIMSMADFLRDNGVEEFGDDEELTLAQLALLSTMANAGDQPGRLLEEARGLVFRNHMDHPAWLQLVQNMFAG